MKCRTVCILVLSMLLCSNCILFEDTDIDVSDCLLHLINQTFKEDDTLYFVSSETYDTFRYSELTNPYVVVNFNNNTSIISNRNTVKLALMRYAANFIIFKKNKETFKTVLTNLMESDIWKNSISRKGKFLIITTDNEYLLLDIFEVLWKEGIIDVIIVSASNNNNYTLYMADPFHEGNNCGLTPSVFLNQSCNATLKKLVQLPITNLRGCNITSSFTTNYVQAQDRTVYFLLTEAVKILNGSSCPVKTLRASKTYKIIIYLRHVANSERCEISKIIYRQFWMWVTYAPIRIYPFDTIRSLFQVEVWILTGFLLVITTGTWWIISILKVDSDNLIMQTAFSTNLLQTLTIPHYTFRFSNSKELIEWQIPIYIHFLQLFIFFETRSSNNPVYNNLRKQFLKCMNYSDVIDFPCTYRNSAILMTEFDLYQLSYKGNYNSFIEEYISSIDFVFTMIEGHYFIESLNKVITLLEESGIYQKHIKESQIVSNNTLDNTFLPLNMEHTYFIFAIWLLGLLLSFIVFLLECFYYFYSSNNTNRLNKEY
ncbi:hypothetical protein FQA39_LY00972 [Lamprigera yunnana]|nr:hypothetical protein FQA39_LY00972 [Lamprigera yunnana]